MDDLTRRGVLTSTAVLLGATAGCQAWEDDDGGASPTATTGNGDGRPTSTATDTSTAVGTETNNAIYVEESVGDLPNAPSGPAFGVTSNGIYQFDGSNTRWRQIQYGSDNNPAPAITAESATVGHQPNGRPLISNGNRTFYVDPNGGNDGAPGTQDQPLETIQEALNRVPIYLRDQYTIDLATVPQTPVTYDEDVLVPTIIGTGQAGKEDGAPSAGPIMNLRLRGKPGDPTAVELGSIMLANVIGTSACHVSFVTLTRNSPYDDEEYGLAAYGMGEVHLYNVRFTAGPTNGIIGYGSSMKASIIDLGEGNLRDGLRSKRHASIITRDVSGTVNGAAYFASANSKLTIRDGNEATGNPTFRARVGGLIYDEDSESWFGLDGPIDTDNPDKQVPADKPNPATRQDHPDDPDPGEVWYVDGAGDVEEGFYGQTSGGLTKLG